ncbi:MAG: NrfD/PsrC family molybdoenzyme membrane anchor subunit [Raoultibacter sp.]
MGFMQSDWGITVVLDLFMGGGGAGLLVLSALLWLTGKEKCRDSAAIGGWICFGCIVIGLLCLLADVGQPLRAMLLPVSFSHFTSWMTFGAWFMLAALIVSFAFALSVTDRTIVAISRFWKGFTTHRNTIANISGVIGIAAGFMVTIYTGFLISSAEGVPFWSTLLLPAGFCASAFYLAALIMLAILSRPKSKGDLQKMRLTLTVMAFAFAAAFITFAAAHLAVASSGDLIHGSLLASTGAAEAAQTSARVILSGDLSTLFWIGLVAVGLVLPLALAAIQWVPFSFIQKRRLAIAVATATCALAGVFLWRYLVLAVGIHQPLPNTDIMHIVAGTTFLFG